jgi:hypothetical protein
MTGDLENVNKAAILIKWLEVLQHGRTKPDNKSSGVVRDAKDYIGYIKGINLKLAELLNVEEQAV